jgi:rhodanese-related sulfurtransferase
MTTRTITAKSTMQEVLETFPAAQRALFRKYHIGGCSSCGFQPSDALQDVLRSHDCQDSIESVVSFLQESQSLDDRTKVAPKTLKQWLDAKQALKLVDMRGPDETASGMLDGAMQLSQDLVRQMHEEWPKSTKIVLYCQRGMRSADGAAYLAGHGFTSVWSLAGGIEAWAAEVDPKVRRW